MQFEERGGDGASRSHDKSPRYPENNKVMFGNLLVTARDSSDFPDNEMCVICAYARERDRDLYPLVAKSEGKSRVCKSPQQIEAQCQYGRRTSAVFTSLPTHLRDERERENYRQHRRLDPTLN
ncbi:hypothetical protein PUN28_003792 [Cardiocondyla obscurior]|uniref:Uncharacterized protein n=1 Tax=Cardiocondyla obscurior TaxID=286306 RepID=A0AAW2GM49_9HYME